MTRNGDFFGECVYARKAAEYLERERKKPQTGDEVQVCGEQVTSSGELRG